MRSIRRAFLITMIVLPLSALTALSAAEPAPRVRLETTLGNVVLELDRQQAPVTVENFLKYVNDGFYDGTVFHRVIDGFMAQTGCPQGTGTGGSSYPDLEAEFNAEPHVRGVCSMARAASPNSANSQFFICFDDASFLNRQYTIWGQVSEGMEHIDALPRGEPVPNPGRIVTMRVAADC